MTAVRTLSMKCAPPGDQRICCFAVIRCQHTSWRGLLQSRCKLALACIVCRSTASNVMKTLASWAPAPNLTVTAIESGDPDWIVSVDSRDAEQDRDRASCPVCGIQSSSRHSSYIRTLRDLSAQGRRVNIQARLTRWRCRNDQCDRRIFAERLPTLATHSHAGPPGWPGSSGCLATAWVADPPSD